MVLNNKSVPGVKGSSGEPVAAWGVLGGGLTLALSLFDFFCAFICVLLHTALQSPPVPWDWPFPFVEPNFDSTTILHFSVLGLSHIFKRMLVLALLLTNFEKVLEFAFCNVGTIGWFSLVLNF